ncbi:MAG: hypothetical protein AAB643_00065, partial [Patescibacteria group bacterium]
MFCSALLLTEQAAGLRSGAGGIPPRPSESDLLKKDSDFVKQTRQNPTNRFFIFQTMGFRNGSPSKNI